MFTTLEIFTICRCAEGHVGPTGTLQGDLPVFFTQIKCQDTLCQSDPFQQVVYPWHGVGNSEMALSFRKLMQILNEASFLKTMTIRLNHSKLDGLTPRLSMRTTSCRSLSNCCGTRYSLWKMGLLPFSQMQCSTRVVLPSLAVKRDGISSNTWHRLAACSRPSVCVW